MGKVTCADEEAGDAADAVGAATAEAAAGAKQRLWGKEGAGGASNSPVFADAVRGSAGITRSQIVLPEYVRATIADVKEAVERVAGQADKKLLYPAFHMLANFALNEYGTQAAKAVQGIFPELGARLAQQVPIELILGGEEEEDSEEEDSEEDADSDAAEAEE